MSTSHRSVGRALPAGRERVRALAGVLAVLLAVGLTACGGNGGEGADGRGTGSGRRGGPGFGGGPPPAAGVPVEVEAVARGPIALYFETNGTLEAERDVDLVARAAGPIVELRAEEGQRVETGQLLARIDDGEIRAQLAVAEVQLEEARATRERVRSLFADELVSREDLDRAEASWATAQGDVERSRIQLDYTRVAAPFTGRIARRYVRFAQHVASGEPLFRLSDFDPLLCPIQVPERELSRLRLGQPAVLEVEAFGGERFTARVLRMSPVVDAGSGTVRVTLEVDARGKLRPGMFASVYLELDKRPDALVVAKAALALDSLGDAVYVVEDGTARRRSVTLGFQSADRLEVAEGLAEGERVVVVGQDGLSDGTPIEVVGEGGTRLARQARPEGGPGGAPSGGPGGFRIDLDDPQAVERAKAFMRQRGLSDEQIEARLARMRDAGAEGGDAAAGAGGERAAGGPAPGVGRARGTGGPGGFRIDFDDPQAVARAKAFMRQRGLSDEQIEERLARLRERQEAAEGESGQGGGDRP